MRTASALCDAAGYGWLVVAVYTAYLAVQYQTQGFGLHPWLAAAACFVSIVVAIFAFDMSSAAQELSA